MAMIGKLAMCFDPLIRRPCKLPSATLLSGELVNESHAPANLENLCDP